MKLSKTIKSQLCHMLAIIPDKPYIHMQYYLHMKRKLNLKQPKTFNEKIQWLKIYDRKPLYTSIVDKYNVRNFVEQKIGKDYLIPLLGVWENANEIDFKILPKTFVLKCTHDSGSVIICRNKDKMDFSEVKRRMNRALSQNVFFNGREWAYRNVQPRIIAEVFLSDEFESEPIDYKLFCFNGKVELIQVDTGRFVDHKRNLYTRHWEPIMAELCYPRNNEKEVECPSHLKKIVEIASNLSSGFTFVRVDLYIIRDQVYFGELTLYPGSGFEQFRPNFWDERLGSLIQLPLENN